MRLFSVPISGLEEPTHEESCDCYRGSGRWPHLPRFGWQRVRWFAWWRLRQRAQLLCARADLLRPSAEVLQRAPLQEVALLQVGLRAEVRLRSDLRSQGPDLRLRTEVLQGAPLQEAEVLQGTPLLQAEVLQRTPLLQDQVLQRTPLLQGQVLQAGLRTEVRLRLVEFVAVLAVHDGPASLDGRE